MDSILVQHPSAWTSAEIGGREGLTHRLSAEHLETLDRAAERIADKPFVEIGPDDFQGEPIRNLMRAVRYQLRHGYGAMVLAGLDLDRYGEELFGKLYYGLGTFLGRPAVQSIKCDLLGRVEQLADNPAGRGYQSNIELGPHTDFHELLSLASVRPAAEGGESGLTSSLAIYNVFVRERPDLLPAMQEGYWFDNGDGANTAYKVPVFGSAEGLTSCYAHPMLFWIAAAQRKEQLPESLREGLEFFGEVSRRPELQARFMLQPGEMMFWHNFTVLHSRTQFENAPGQSRLILRLWIHADDKRPMPKGFVDKGERMDSMHARGEVAIRYDLPALKELMDEERRRAREKVEA